MRNLLQATRLVLVTVFALSVTNGCDNCDYHKQWGCVTTYTTVHGIIIVGKAIIPTTNQVPHTVCEIDHCTTPKFPDR